MVGESLQRWKGELVVPYPQKRWQEALDSLPGPLSCDCVPVGTTPEVRPELTLVSACLAGRACRYDGSSNEASEISRLVADGRAVLVCPEEDGGLGTPRPPAEIEGGDGNDVLEGRARVVTKAGQDVTDAYLAGARHALEVAQKAGVTRAILKSRSPSCGRGAIYDGSFSRTLQVGDGVTAALLASHGIAIVSEEDI
jgi:uncharacterized protein YbbK (DUF523 family)